MIVTQAKVNGIAVVASKWEVKLGSFGSVDAATIETDVEKLKAAGVNLVALAEKHKLPVHFIGVGESIDDLAPFTARDFARAIAGIEP